MVKQDADRFCKRFLPLGGEFGELRKLVVPHRDGDNVSRPVQIGHFHFAHIDIIGRVMREF